MTEETLEPVETETDPEERIRELTAENRRLRKRIKQMREAAATSKKVEFSKIIFCGVSIVTISITVFSCWIIYSTMDTSLEVVEVVRLWLHAVGVHQFDFVFSLGLRVVKTGRARHFSEHGRDQVGEG